MPQNFQPGDFLVFQLEAGYALLRLLAVEEEATDIIWHVAAYADLFPDVETAERSALQPDKLSHRSRCPH